MSNQDWHPADIIAALHKRGTSVAALSRRAGLASATLGNTLKRPWPKGEWLIAHALGLHPASIWPSRYNLKGARRHPRNPLPPETQIQADNYARPAPQTSPSIS